LGKIDVVLIELERYTEISKWRFVYGTPEAIVKVFTALESTLQLDANYGTDYVFIVDKDMRLRHSNDKKEIATTKGYNANTFTIASGVP
jgi:hypothetical protein